MRIIKRSLAFVLMLLALESVGQVSGFHFKNKIAEFKEAGWYSIFLPDSIYSALNPSFSDIRIYQFKGKDTLEAPYLLHILESENADETIGLKMVNKSTRDGKLYCTFELGKNQHVNYLDLDFEEDNFNGYVQLEGSNDQKEWFKIDTLKRILAIRRDDLNFKSTSLSFPESIYSFLRLAIKADRPLLLKAASFKNRVTRAGVYVKAGEQYTTTNSQKTKQTMIVIPIKKMALVSQVCIVTDHAQDFYRPITIEAVRDSSKTPKGWLYYYETLFSGTITSLNDNCFEFQHFLAKRLRVTIYNSDNAPLTIKSLDVYGPVVQLVARLEPGDNQLFYGSPALDAPSYDIVHFADKIPVSPASLSLSQQENLLHPAPQRSPLFESKNWLWIAMAIVILVLGYFTMSMMKKK